MPFKNKKKEKESKKKYDEKRAGRTRNWTAIVYPEDTPEKWQDMLDERLIRWIESPLHDKDITADGTPKKPHYHILMMFENVKTKEQVKNFLGEIFGTSENDSIIGVASPQEVSDKCALVRYFAHLDHPDKAQYNVEEIKGHCGADVGEILRSSQKELVAMMTEIEEFIEDNNITELCDLSKCIRQINIDWYILVATKHTIYFSNFLRSRRHKAEAEAEKEKRE